jgi:hypothetical protein
MYSISCYKELLNFENTLYNYKKICENNLVQREKAVL